MPEDGAEKKHLRPETFTVCVNFSIFARIAKNFLMIDSILLAPYYWTLKTRHFLYDHGFRKIHVPELPTISLGNLTVGGTGKTPHTEMILRTLLEDPGMKSRQIAVLSRGYGRKSKGFQQVPADGTARLYGDEPLQMKKKFPEITVAVDRSRIEGCQFLQHPENLQTSAKGKKCQHKDFPAADLIILDDAFQYRALKADLSILLINSFRPIYKDHLMPMGKLRDLPERIEDADIVIITKCDKYIDEWKKSKWAEALGLSAFDGGTCCGIRSNGKKQYLFFTAIDYCEPQPVFPEGDARFLYSKSLILFSGIANDKLLYHHLTGTYKIQERFNFPDHHKFSKGDVRKIAAASKASPTSVIMTTEKDCQRIRDSKIMTDELKRKMFYTPIKVNFTCANETEVFRTLLLRIISPK